MINQRGGRWTARMWTPVVDGQRKRIWLGTFDTREEAAAAERAAGADFAPRRCKVCLRRFRPMWKDQERCGVECERSRRSLTRPSRVGQNTGTKDHWVYFCVDHQGELLYVGVTSAGIRRQQEHARKADWWRSVEHIRVEHYTTRDEAVAREKQVISDVDPICNRGNGSHWVANAAEEAS